MNSKTKHWLLQIFATKIGWLGISLLCVLVFGILSNFYEWAYWPAILAWVYPTIFGIVGIIYAWIINPIRSYKENKKK